MHICVIIPAHNEARFLAQCLSSFVSQSQPPNELIVVDDNSSDETASIAQKFAGEYPWIKLRHHQSANQHLPGQKVVEAFNFGLQHAQNYDLIGKFDADIILPPNYFEQMRNYFQSDWKLGVCGGLLYIKKEGGWMYENIADKSHVRGPIKLYHKACFQKINGLRAGTGWDTVDILLAKYHGFTTKTDASLKVKHLRPTGHGYSHLNHKAKGAALYKMRYGLPLAKIALLKMAVQAKNPALYILGLYGFLRAFFLKTERFVTKKEGKYVRQLRWNGIFKKLKVL
ncbi:Glycosyl transferase family 2 [Croceitalea dokdonensis DOKDO 023]|uniref:Glycosyl transferase family 2 n=1 Tax=Croceitalea dokdonensis DOKDO 023 TaxID=1300341 RepID=A0A0P7AGI6_9FLAO|nr:glycosyltransferase family 2 protein [Croceitalea dokdonensis]KPM32553.1 Glycosyl transferase family 2 [Croceitalea dokdonensis DOKDO 023]